MLKSLVVFKFWVVVISLDCILVNCELVSVDISAVTVVWNDKSAFLLVSSEIIVVGLFDVSAIVLVWVDMSVFLIGSSDINDIVPVWVDVSAIVLASVDMSVFVIGSSDINDIVVGLFDVSVIEKIVFIWIIIIIMFKYNMKKNEITKKLWQKEKMYVNYIVVKDEIHW